MSREKRKSKREMRKDVLYPVPSIAPDSFAPKVKRAAPLEPRTEVQSEYMHLIRTKNIVLVTGLPGTGKTYIAARMAAQMMRDREIDKIVLVRPAMSDSQSLGYFKGTATEKMMNWLAPVMGALKEDFSYGEIEYMLKDGINRIECVPLETIKGMSFKRAFVIIDEAEDITVKEATKILPRIGEGTKMVLAGDTRQSDLKSGQVSGLMFAIDAIRNNPALRLTSGSIDFSEHGTIQEGGDIIRSRPAADWIRVLYQD